MSCMFLFYVINQKCTFRDVNIHNDILFSKFFYHDWIHYNKQHNSLPVSLQPC